MYQYEDYFKMNKERLITTASNSSDDIRTHKTTITRKKKLEEKQLYGYFKRETDEVSHQKTWTWLKREILRKKQSLRIAVQNKAIRNNYVKAIIDKTQLDCKCRLYGDRDKMINHIMSECTKLAQMKYKSRHKRVGKVMERRSNGNWARN